jgi:hypothetical protein
VVKENQQGMKSSSKNESTLTFARALPLTIEVL